MGMTVENISWPISTLQWCLTARANPWQSGRQSDSHLTVDTHTHTFTDARARMHIRYAGQPHLSPDCLLMFSVVLPSVVIEQPYIKEKRPSVFYREWPWPVKKHMPYLFCLFCCFTSQVNSYGHCGTVSSPNHTFSWAGLNKLLTSN